MSSIFINISVLGEYCQHTIQSFLISDSDCEVTGLTPRDFYNKLKIAFPAHEGFTITCEATRGNVPISFDNDTFLQPAPVLLGKTG